MVQTQKQIWKSQADFCCNLVSGLGLEFAEMSMFYSPYVGIDFTNYGASFLIVPGGEKQTLLEGLRVFLRSSGEQPIWR